MDKIIKVAIYATFIANSISFDSYSNQEYFNSLSNGQEIKGQLKSVRNTILSSEMSGNINRISVKEGDRFKRYNTLVDLDCNIQKAEKKKAIAINNADKARVEINNKLNKLSSISQLDYKLAEYKAQESAAEVDIINTRLKDCKIRAPYSGIVEEQIQKQHEYVKAGDPVLKILDDSTLEVELLVPSEWTTWVKKGTIFTALISEIDKKYEAKITYLGAKIDPVSQSLKIKGSIDNSEKLLKSGMSVTAIFKKD